MSDALILIGGPGSGKSSVLDALGTMLEIDDVQFGAIETEQLARGWPWLNPAQWMPQLEAVIEFLRRAGRQRFLVAATTETEQELRAVVMPWLRSRLSLSVSERLPSLRLDAWPSENPTPGQASAGSSSTLGNSHLRSRRSVESI